MKLFNNFAAAAMNKDLELRLMPKSFYLDAKNVRILTPQSENSRSVKFPLGNTAVTTLALGTNAVSTGFCVDGLSNKIYWVVRSDSGSFVCEYDTDNDAEAIVLSDNRGALTRVFDFPSTGNVEMRVLNDNDNGRNFLFIADGVGEPYYFEIAAAKALPDNTFTLQNVSLIKAPPVSAPTLTLGNTATSKENNIETKFLSFAYRYKYGFGEVSALSSFSEFAFLPSGFSFDYGTGTNKSMFNAFSKATVAFNAGGADVTGVDIIVKQSGSNTAYIVESFDKTNEGWADGSAQSIDFANSKIYRALDSNQLTRIFDNVPTVASTVEVIGNRLVFGNYSEGYDIVNGSDITIYPSFTLSYNSAAGTAGVAHQQVKANRDYEIALAYLDGKGRMTTPITAEGNTTFVENQFANQKNTLEVTITSEAPAWATGYRFFIKQSKINYDTIAPITFYRDGIFAWIKIQGNDSSKIKEGDFVYVKSDTSGLKNTTIRTKILEVTEKDRNFLETDQTIIDGVATLQQDGLYFKVEVNDYSLSEAAVTNFTGSTVFAFRSSSTANNIEGSVTYIDDIYYKGVGLNDLTDNNTYSGSDDIRYEIQVDGVVGTNTFQWREFNVSTGVTGAYTTLVAMTGGAQTLSNGLQVTWGATTGHTLNDEWVIPCKALSRTGDWNKGGSVGGDGRRAIMLFQSKDTVDESIKAGASITLTYDDSASGSNVQNIAGLVSESLTSSQDYPNLEEWFYGDNIVTSMTYPADVTRIMFRRGTLLKTDGQQMTVTGSTGRLYMAMLSQCDYTGSGGSEIRIDTSISITELDNAIVFETIPVDENTEIFYELPRTYSISGSNHLGNGGSDTNQNFGITPATINLEYFNSFGWYNGFESIKIGDTFNENTMRLDTKPLIPIDDYKQITRIASLTYSGVYEATTGYNALNEFNLANVNYKDMDTKYGSIQKLHSKDTDILVFQEDKTHRVLFSKSILFNADGQGNVTQSSNVLGQEVAYQGEYGIGLHPESFAFFGNRIYHLDEARGALMRLGVDGYTEISKKGLSDYFRTLGGQTNYVGGYDPYNDEYLINVAPDASPLTVSFTEGEQGGFSAFYEFEPERLVGVNNRLYSMKNGQIYLHDSNATRNNFYGDQRVASITTVFNDKPNDVKHWKSINTESSSAWDVSIVSSQATGTIADTEFELAEGEYYAYIRQNETPNTFGTSTYQGIGNITTISVLTVGFGFEIPRNLAVGDVIYESVAGEPVARGTVTAIDVTAGTITLDSVANLLVGDFVMYGKDARVEGEAIKGYDLKMTLSNSASTDEELFAVKVEAVRSSD
mgnify:CR=1 FL=1|tara:strand:+ start:11034 stop:14969 length:3936 start_codon:yes stop_codon:yes gene_type:complete